MLDQRGQEMAALARSLRSSCQRSLVLEDTFDEEGSRIRGFNMEDIIHLESRLAEFQRTGSSDVTLRINSRGGLLEAADHLVQVIESSPVRVCGLVTKDCRSSAFFVLEHCYARFALKGAVLSMHDLSRRFEVDMFPDDDPVEIGKIAEALARENKSIIQALREQTAQAYHRRMPSHPVSEIIKIMRDRRKLFSADEALEFGMLDAVI